MITVEIIGNEESKLLQLMRLCLVKLMAGAKPGGKRDAKIGVTKSVFVYISIGQ